MTHPANTGMVERVAEALKPFFSAAERACGEPMEAARAAIQAMREPTDGMVLAGHQQVDDPRGGFVDVTNVIDGWHAMIDAASSEGKEG